MKILVTGHAGFIGYHVARTLLERGDDVVGFDLVNDYYDPALKEARLRELDACAEQASSHYASYRENLADARAVNCCFADHDFDRVIHLAAQAGVRYSLENPMSYVESNIVGFTNILEACRHNRVSHLTYASTSSVYGANTRMPYREDHTVAYPLQFYAATKLANEHMAHSYSHLFGLPTTGLRFFTVYGPWGRPDMAPIRFARAIDNGEPLAVYNYGNHSRDFTYIDDIVAGVIKASDQIAAPDPAWTSDAPNPATSNAPYRIFNIGNNQPVPLMDFIGALEKALGKSAELELLPLQLGDVPDTFADSSRLVNATGYQPNTRIEDGVDRYVEWYRNYYRQPESAV